MLTSDFDFELPQELIAQEPFFPKEQTKMLVFKGNEIFDKKVINLFDYLGEGDVLVFNDARVIKAKLSAKILRSGANLEFNLDQENQGIWRALCKPAKKVKAGDILEIATDFSAEVLEKTDDGFIKIKFNDNWQEKLEKYGTTPLPPYIKRDEKNILDNKNYQTVYAKDGLAVAAPTAGLHFTKAMLDELEKRKIKKVFVTLNVGAGTFLPVRSESILDHKMHEESFTISVEAAQIINDAKKQNKKIIAVGTTSLRALESAALEGFVEAKTTTTKIFIYPPYKFKIVDILMTNFHLPKSTLFMLVSAFVGRDNAFRLYKHAIEQSYRFYSYGDTSLLMK